jgi:hypothetical protein
VHLQLDRRKGIEYLVESFAQELPGEKLQSDINHIPAMDFSGVYFRRSLACRFPIGSIQPDPYGLPAGINCGRRAGRWVGPAASG